MRKKRIMRNLKPVSKLFLGFPAGREGWPLFVAATVPARIVASLHRYGD